MHACPDEHGQNDSLPHNAKEGNIKSPIHIVDGEYITDWLALGPFFDDYLSTFAL